MATRLRYVGRQQVKTYRIIMTIARRYPVYDSLNHRADVSNNALVIHNYVENDLWNQKNTQRANVCFSSFKNYKQQLHIYTSLNTDHHTNSSSDAYQQLLENNETYIWL